MSGYDELDIFVSFKQIVKKKQKAQLTLRRQCCFRFVHEIKAGASETILQQRQKRFSVRLVMEALVSIAFQCSYLINVTRHIKKTFGPQIEDKTGLAGTYDFVVEWTPQFDSPLPPGANFQPDPAGPTFLEALKEQLGLKLEPLTGPVDVLVIDHVEEPSAN